MFDTLPASITPRGPRSRPVLLALAAHTLVIGVAVGGTSSSPETPPKVHRDTVRFEMTELQRPHQSDFRPDAFLPSPPPLPDALFDAPEIPSPTLSFSGASGPGDPGRFVTGPDRGTVSGPIDSSRMVFNSIEVDQLPELVRELRLRYPVGLERAGVSGVVHVEYVVGSDGRVHQQSVRALSSTHPAFFRAALEALRDARFKPARRGGRSIAVLVQQTFRFRQQ